MGTVQAGDPVGAVEEIGPVLREHAVDGERQRRLAPAALEAMRAAGLFRMLLPRSLGGMEADPVTFARTVEAVSRHDAAAGWALQAGNIGDWFGARLPDEGAEEVFGDDPDQLQAAAFHPPLPGTPADGGIRVGGQRPLASAVHDAGWLFVTALVGEIPVGAVVRTAEVRILNTWDPLGMRGTDSNDVVLDDVFVPDRRTFVFAPGFTPGSRYGGALYRMPVVAIMTALLAPIALAIAREAIADLRALAPSKASLGSARVLRDRSVAHGRLGRAEGLVRAARAALYATLDEEWHRVSAGVTPTVEDRAGDLLAGAHAVLSAVEAVDLVYGLAGSAAVYERSPIERHFRDINTVRHHGFVCESRLEAVGQVMLGVDPEFALVAL